ncbi:calcium-dependent protein kinase 4-like [Tachysurus ichikawai]
MQVVQAAPYCCNRGVLHRDIKPKNLLINPSTLEVKLIDFVHRPICTVTPLSSTPSHPPGAERLLSPFPSRSITGFSPRPLSVRELWPPLPPPPTRTPAERRRPRGRSAEPRRRREQESPRLQQ